MKQWFLLCTPLNLTKSRKPRSPLTGKAIGRVGCNHNHNYEYLRLQPLTFNLRL